MMQLSKTPTVREDLPVVVLPLGVIQPCLDRLIEQLP